MLKNLQFRGLEHLLLTFIFELNKTNRNHKEYFLNISLAKRAIDSHSLGSEHKSLGNEIPLGDLFT